MSASCLSVSCHRFMRIATSSSRRIELCPDTGFFKQMGLSWYGMKTVPRFTGKTRITGKTTKIPERPKNNREILICPSPIKKTIIDY